MMKGKKHYSIILILLYPFFFNALFAVNDAVYDTIMQRIRVNEWEGVADVPKLNTTVANLLTTINSDGSWADIDYNSTAMTNWPGTTHLERVVDFTLAYTLISSNYYRNAIVYQKIVSALTYFYNKNPISNNWYVHQIGNPQQLGRILILMRSGAQQVSSTLETNILTRIKNTGGNPLNYTGSNKVAVAMHWVYRGCLSKDQTALTLGVNEVYEPVYMTTQEGLQHDYSFFQHGQQLYSGGYAVAFVRHAIVIAGATKGTEFAMDQVKQELLVKFFRDHFLNLIRGSAFLYNTVGRGLAIQGGIGASYVSAIVSNFKKVDPDNQFVYDAAIERLKGNKSGTYLVPVTHYHYWRGDYTLTTSPGYTFDIRMASTRTARSENGNGENLKGYFLTEGANAIVIEGNEYRNIFPVWDWAKIPGTTLPQKTTIPKPTQWEKPGNAIFAGGVSNGNYGVTTYQMDNPDFNVNTQAKKSWFMFGEEIVCLGAGIKSTAAEEINTTVNQCMQSGTAVVKHNNSETYIQIGSTSTYTSNLDWIHHNKIAYFFPKGGNVNLSFGPQSGTWQSITSAQSSTTVTSNVFNLWFNHGIKPLQSKYEYVIVPNKTLAQTRTYNVSDIVVAANGEDVQAVYNRKLNLWGMVFYKATTFSYGDLNITVDAPCVLMFEKNNAQLKCWLADPSQNATSIKVCYASNSSGYYEEIVNNMPKMPYAGSTVEFSFNIQTSNNDIKETDSVRGNRLNINPVNRGETVSLTFNALSDLPVRLILSDMSGKVIMDKMNETIAGENLFSIETDMLTPGVYLICTINDKSEIRRNRLIIR